MTVPQAKPGESLLSPHWVELPPKYGRDAWELRVCDDHWYRVFGARIVLCPQGIGQGVRGSTVEAMREVEQTYRRTLRNMVERANRMTLTANAGLAMLDG